MRASFRKYSRHRLVHAIIIAIAILIGVIIALAARPTRGVSFEQALDQWGSNLDLQN